MIQREARLVGTTRNYYKYSYSTGSENGFIFYIAKSDVGEEPPKRARLRFEEVDDAK